MKVGEIDEDINGRELLTDPLYKRIDKNGRLYFGVEMANREVLVILVKPKPEDKIKWLKV